ncbi:MAG: methyl-accepting chemotaxis protein [Steroidobacter sp.]
MKLTIRGRLFSLVALMLVLIIVLGAVARNGMSAARGGLESVVITARTLRNHLEGDMMHDALRADVLSALLADSSEDVRSAHTDLQEHAQHFRELLASNEKLATDEDKEVLSAIGPSLDSYIRSAEEIVTVVQNDKARARGMLPEFQRSFEDLERRMAAASDRIESGAQTAEKEAGAVIDHAMTFGLVALIVAALIAFVVSGLTVRAITVGLQGLFAVIARMANGELGRGIRIENQDEFGALLTQLQALDHKLASIVTTVHASAKSVGTAAGEISQGNDDLSHRTQEQAAALEETASSMEEMSGTVKQNAENVRAANQLAIGTRGQAERGGAVVQQAVTAMEQIDDSSRRIADIIGVVDEIAFQTNLLALNAAVEAARAGEQGRGFAVVAAEVRSLAQRSAASAKEVKGLIQLSVDRVKTGTALVGESGRTMQEITLSVSKLTDIVAEIAAATDEQSRSIEEVNRAVAQIDMVTQQNAALVQEAAAASKSMEHQTGQLLAEVGFFKTNSDAPAATRSRQGAAHEIEMRHRAAA